jgi:hypothetical protein
MTMMAATKRASLTMNRARYYISSIVPVKLENSRLCIAMVWHKADSSHGIACGVTC